MLTSILTVVHLIAAIAIVALVLLQQGKGADMGAAFGSGSSGSLFGAQGSANFLSRSTSVLALVFFTTGLSLAYIYSKQGNFESVTESVIESSVNSSDPVPAIPGNDAESQGAESDMPAVPDTNSQ
ncbi:MAG: preprotein translocase subunit SecG [Parasphingorhabdus sp.]|jgi:preprotein translocase subunit SecG